MPRWKQGRRVIAIKDRARTDIKFRYVGSDGGGQSGSNSVKWASCQTKLSQAFNSIPRTSVDTWFATGWADQYRGTIQAVAVTVPLFAAGAVITAFGTTTGAAATLGVAGELGIGVGALPLAGAVNAAAGGKTPARSSLPKVHRSSELNPPKFTSFSSPCKGMKAKGEE